MMNSKAKKLISVVLCLVLCLGGLYALTFLTERKNSYEKYKAFFDEKNDFDVLFVGTSHIMNGVYPMELWNDYGIVSYNFGGHANMIPTSYWVLRNALDYTSPKLVVMDCQGLSYNYKYSDNWYFLHLSFDAFPLSTNKIRAVRDLFDSEGFDVPQAGLERATPISLLWDFSVYHSRWAELTAEDFKPELNIEKGAESRIGIDAPNKIKRTAEKFDGGSIGIRYLERIITECRQSGIDVLLVNLPLPATESQLMDANRIYDLAKELNVNYINFFDLDIVDYDTDMYDSDSHLNPSGARKVTDYLGRYIRSNYDIPDHRNDTSFSSWHDDYSKYTEFKISNLKQAEKLDVYMTLLTDKNISVETYIGNEGLLTDSYYSRFFANLGIDAPSFEADNTDADVRFVVLDKNTGNIIDSASFIDGIRLLSVK